MPAVGSSSSLGTGGGEVRRRGFRRLVSNASASEDTSFFESVSRTAARTNDKGAARIPLPEPAAQHRPANKRCIPQIYTFTQLWRSAAPALAEPPAALPAEHAGGAFPEALESPRAGRQSEAASSPAATFEVLACVMYRNRIACLPRHSALHVVPGDPCSLELLRTPMARKAP